MDDIIRTELEAYYCLLMALIESHPDRKLLRETFETVVAAHMYHHDASPKDLQRILDDYRAMIG